jgi:hypothetical protein
MEAAQKKQITIDDIFALFKESEARLEKESAERKELAAEWNTKFQKESAEWRERSEIRIAEAEARSAREDKKLRKQLGGIGNTLCGIAEQMVNAGVAEVFNSYGYTFGDSIRHYELTVDKKIIGEVDIVLFDGDFLAFIEVKSKVEKEHIRQHLDRIDLFKKHEKGKFWENKKIVGAIGGMVFSDEACDIALKNGLYVIKQSGKNLKMDEPPQRLVV